MIPSVIGPIALIGGWVVAAAKQPAGYSQRRQTISALAARGAHDRLIMTVGLMLLGVCYLAIAAGLRDASRQGRIALAVGGLATVAVSLFPQPYTGSSAAHVVSATIGFAALAVWPALSGRVRTVPRRASIAATVVLVGLLIWFGVSLGGADVGLAERVLAGAESLWPLVVVSICQWRSAQ